MKDNRPIIVLDVKEGRIDAYKDIAAVVSRVGGLRKSLVDRLDDGMFYVDGLFVGYADVHKSNRGGNRKSKSL